jgi:hypothetical protein
MMHARILGSFQLEEGGRRIPTGGVRQRAVLVSLLLHVNEVVPSEQAIAGREPKPITDVASGFAGNAPLWAYVPSEAQVTSWQDADPRLAKNDIPVKLGPVGGRLVAEVFASLLRGDPTSYLNADHKFVPVKDFTHAGRFGLAELINITLGRNP